MARLEVLDKTGASTEVIPFYGLDDERYGQALNKTKVHAHDPAVIRAIKTFVGAYNDLGELPTILKALVRLIRVAALSGYPF